MERRAALAPRCLKVSQVEVVDFVRGNPSVRAWLGKYSSELRDESEDGLSGSRLNKARILCRFFKWLRVKEKVVMSPLELLEWHRGLRLSESSTIDERKWLLNLVLKHSRDNPDFREYSDIRKYDIFQGIKGFCDYHEVPLTTAKNIYGKRKKKKNRRKQITLAGAKKVLGRLSQRDRTILILMLQSGIELGGILDKFNYMWHIQVKPQLDAGCERLKIEFDERKGNGTYYFTFISRDGIHELQKWLIERKRIVEALIEDGEEVAEGVVEGEPIFITNRGKMLWEQSFARQLKHKTDGRVTSHMFRKLFESEAKVPDRGIDREVVKFWMGHVPKLDEVGGIYDRNVEIREEIYEKEYAKLEPFINIYSSSVASGRSDPLLADIQNVMREEGGREFFERLLKKMDEETSDWLKKGRADP